MATKLSVEKFSCIKHAELELSRLTVLIGPSASGKSVLSKLVYFFHSLLSDQFQAIEDGQPFKTFRQSVKEKFKEWFPVDAWGNNKFCIEFEAGAYQVKITRVEARHKVGENVRIWFSSFFEEQYTAAALSFQSSKKSASLDPTSLEAFWRVREAATVYLKRVLKDDFPDIQTFVPAGRSFFTSVGKSIAVFEHGRILDPLTVRFGRAYISMQERAHMRRIESTAPKWLYRLNEIMDGKYVSERSKEYFQTSDGRRIPLSALSSGQQELMPLMLAIQQRVQLPPRYQQLLYIEEPEAHLFPSAQSSLVEIFGLFLSTTRGRAKLLITTHSPYVLAKINNLIKAKEVSDLRTQGTPAKRAPIVEKVIPPGAWIDGDTVRAYAIQDGNLVSIQDPLDGMIEGDYLDRVSGDIAAEFSKLLELELEQ